MDSDPRTVPFAPGDDPLPGIDVNGMAKLYGDSLSGDMLRCAKRGELANVDIWNPHHVIIPPEVVHPPVEFSEEYEAGFMIRADVTPYPPCALGHLCQGNTLSTILPAPLGGFTLPCFFDPNGRCYFGLCILCLRLGIEMNNIKGRRHSVLARQGFKASTLAYEKDRIVFNS